MFFSKLTKHLGIFFLICLLGIMLATPALGGSSFLYGDVNRNGTVNVTDAVLVLRHTAGLEALEGDAWYAADVDGSNSINVADAILILRKIVGLIDLFPVEEDLDRAIAAAIAAIDALPAPGDLTLEHKGDVEAARALVDAAKDLGATDDEITNLAKLVTAEETIAALEAATAAVEAAEVSKSQEDVDDARALVAIIPDGGAKADLAARLDAVQAEIDKQAAIADAIAAIDALPAPGDLTLDSKADVEEARSLVDAAMALGATDDDIANLDTLVAAEDTIVALEAATAAVEAAEVGKSQEDVDAARALVALLPDGGAKADLAARLDAVQAEIDKQAAIADAIAAIDALPAPGDLTLDSKADVEEARSLVDAAMALGATDDDIANLDTLVAAEDTIVALEAATAAVEAAEVSKSQEDVDDARALVALLPDGGAKADLAARLDAVQAEIDKQAAIADAIAAIDALPAPGDLTLDSKADVEEARSLVDAAMALGATDDDITNLDTLAAAEDTIVALEAATAAVEAAEASLSRDDANFAFGLVIELPDGPAKVSLLHRLEVVLAEIEKQAAIAAVIAAIEDLPDPGDITLDHEELVAEARFMVNMAKLVHGVIDEEITNLNRLVTAENTIKDLEKATLAVEIAEETIHQPLIDYARALVGRLPEGVAKAALNARLDAVEASIPVAMVLELAEPGDKEPGDEFKILLTIVNKFGNAIPYADAPGTTVITSNLDGELFSGEIVYDGDNGEARVPVTLQTRGLHLITATAAGVSGTLNVNVPASYSAYQMSLSGPAKLKVDEFGIFGLKTWSEEPYGNSSLAATYEYAVTGGDYELYVGASHGQSIELPPVYDSSFTLLLKPLESAVYEIKVTLKNVLGEEIATASYVVEAVLNIDAIASFDDLVVEYGTALEELGLPGQVDVTVHDDTVRSVDVIWDSGTPQFSGTSPGTYTFTGTLVLGDLMENPLNLTAQINVIVSEPVISTYEFSYEVPALIIECEDVAIPVTFATKDLGHIGYDAVLFEFEATGDGDVVFKAVDSMGHLHTFTNSGTWGPPEGFPLPAEYLATTDWTLNFSARGDYTITFRLVDQATGAVIVEGEQAIKVDAYSTYAFSYEVPDLILEGEDVEIPVTFATDEKGSLGTTMDADFSARGDYTITFRLVQDRCCVCD
jgi:hypothetical protein